MAIGKGTLEKDQLQVGDTALNLTLPTVDGQS